MSLFTVSDSHHLSEKGLFPSKMGVVQTNFQTFFYESTPPPHFVAAGAATAAHYFKLLSICVMFKYGPFYGMVCPFLE